MLRAKHLNSDQISQTIAELSSRRDDVWSLSCEILLRSGMRSHELAATNLKDIDSARSLLYVHAAKNSNNRSVPVERACLDALVEHLQGSRMPWQRLSPESFKRMLRRYWKAYREDNLGPTASSCSLHGLRASYAVTIYQNVSHDVLLVKELLGHRSIDNTLRYVKLIQAEQKKDDILSVFQTRKRERPSITR